MEHLRLEALRKSFFGVPVLKGVSLRVGRGRTLGLVGENGAGKSTLMNLVGGVHQPDPSNGGRMLLDGRPYAPAGPASATAAGVALIHQELNLFPNLTVAENLFLTAFPSRAGALIDGRGLRDRAAGLLGRVGLDVSPRTLVEALSPGQRQLVEIAKAVGSGAQLLLFDEPTTSLSGRETEHLFGLIGSLQDEGVTILYISHNLPHVLRLCQEVAVLRDGELVAAGAAAGFSPADLIRHMVGRELGGQFPPVSTHPRPGAPPALEVDGLRVGGTAPAAAFTLRRGEVLGLSGLMGSGRTELLRALFGLDPAATGSVRLGGRGIGALPPRRRARAGLAFLTEERRDEGLMVEASIAENMEIVSLPKFASGPARWIAARALRGRLEEARAAVHLSPNARLTQPAKTLSGGNQQKVVLAKWLLAEPEVYLLDEPTRGIDVGARYEIGALIQDLAAGGAAFLVVSSEIEELLGLCHRVLVLRGGAIVDEVPRAAFDQERILRSALGGGGAVANAC